MTTAPALRVADTNDIDPVAALVADAFGFLEVIPLAGARPRPPLEASPAGTSPRRTSASTGGAHSAATSRLSGTVERTAS